MVRLVVHASRAPLRQEGVGPAGGCPMSDSPSRGGARGHEVVILKLTRLMTCVPSPTNWLSLAVWSDSTSTSGSS